MMMSRHRAFLSFALGIVGLACASPASNVDPPSRSQPSVVVDDTLTLVAGQKASSRDGALELTFVRTESDSRCAKNVVCVWQGDAAVRVRVRSRSGAAVESTIHTALDPKQIEVDQRRITVLEVHPYPGSADPTRPAQIVVRVAS